MSNSPDGRPPGRPSPRLPEPETRADRRYSADPRATPPDTGWHDPAPEDGWSQEPTRGRPEPSVAPPTPAQSLARREQREPRTGLSTFEFQPSPLQPTGQPTGQPAVQPLRAAARAPVPPPPANNRLPQHPQDLYEAAGPSVAAPAQRPDARASAAPATQPAPAPRLDFDATVLSAPTRAQRSTREMAHAPIVEAGSVTGRSLTLVIAIMCFLACMTVGAEYLFVQVANLWQHDIASEVTVQLEDRDRTNIDADLNTISAFLLQQPGITAAVIWSKQKSAEALALSLGRDVGQDDILKELPVPRLIAVEFDHAHPPDFLTLAAAVSGQFKGAVLDDHKKWAKQLRTLTRSITMGGLAILLLVMVATTAIIITATRSALASNRDIVEVLHYVGATDKFIAGQFQKHFLWLGIRAGVTGATLAGLGFLAIPVTMELLGGGSASVTELRDVIGTGALDVVGYGWLVAVVAVVAALCMLTSRIGVYRILHNQQ